MDLFELNEAFAAQSLAVVKDLGCDPAKVHPSFIFSLSVWCVKEPCRDTSHLAYAEYLA